MGRLVRRDASGRATSILWAWLEMDCICVKTVNCICRSALRFCCAVLLSWGQKSHGTNAHVLYAVLLSWDKNPTAPTPSPRARARYRIGGPEVAAAPIATKGGRYKPGAGGAARVPRGAQGCRRCCCCCCCMQKSSAPFFFSFRRFLFCTLVEVRYWPKENVITSSVGGARLLQDAHADEIGA